MGLISNQWEGHLTNNFTKTIDHFKKYLYLCRFLKNGLCKLIFIFVVFTKGWTSFDPHCIHKIFHYTF